MRPLTTVGRLGLAAFGLFLLLVGMVTWSWVTEYGAGINWMVESADEGIERLYIVEERAADPNEPPATRLIFEGTPQEVFEFAEAYEAERRSYVVPAVILVAGALIVIVAIVYPRIRDMTHPNAAQNIRS
ncbi:MAG: hypothetical protein DWQ40_00885 [Actinobacteria bacterium]|nr:MAG: hypothetical protein DWQ40_00885 [Actinomycetota bacterium]